MALISNILNCFEPITLNEMDSVKLLNRVDTKFIYNEDKLIALLTALKENYRVLEINGKRLCRYENLYFDSSDFKLYLQHHNGKLNRYKVRYRRYADSNLNFFEIKFKNNKQRTIKSRVKRKQISNEIQGKSEKLLTEKTPLQSDMLKPVIWVYYNRITLVNKFLPERVTIDSNIRFKSDFTEKDFPGLIIAEVKQDKLQNSQAVSLMKQHHIQNVSISKYCLGVLSLNSSVKKNNFKPKLVQLKKIMR
ncbi:MAG: transporter [Bacteroidetes bacterium CG23_combo_of_CG06-09_8_20_14_all_32_9]|nr:MAG: transporter [Bacteroidetes bacterium CG23_combo_of_CG06-09_8_20_14_all_32_9]